MKTFQRFLMSEDGPSAVEYAILLALIILVSVTTLGGFGLGVNNIYVSINSGLP